MANEKRLIDANALWAEAMNYADTGIEFDGEGVANFIANAPTVDAVEVVHGYWMDSINVDHMGRIIEHGIDCSVCESVFKDDSREVVKRWKQRFEVCPFCGAVMDGERREGE